MSDQWCTIESDPAVFTELMQDIGVTGVEVIELYDIESTTHITKQPNSVLGLIFLFKYDKDLYAGDAGSRAVLEADDDLNNSIFFARQMIHNACGTQAILNILMNIDTTTAHTDIQLGDELNNFKSFASALDAESRGYTIGQSERIRLSHNSYARPEPFIFDSTKDKSDETEDAFHFVAYVPIEGLVYELDGLQQGPILIGAYDTDVADSWIQTAKDAITERINKYAAKEIRFNLMAVVSNIEHQLKEQITAIQTTIDNIQRQLSNTNGDAMQTDDSLPTDKSELQSLLSTHQHQLHDLQDQLQDEVAKHKRFRTENVRRRHNYVPLIYTLANELAKRNQLQPLVDTAQQKVRERNEKKASRQAAEKQAPNAPRKVADGKSDAEAKQEYDAKQDSVHK